MFIRSSKFLSSMVKVFVWAPKVHSASHIGVMMSMITNLPQNFMANRANTMDTFLMGGRIDIMNLILQGLEWPC